VMSVSVLIRRVYSFRRQILNSEVSTHARNPAARKNGRNTMSSSFPLTPPIPRSKRPACSVGAIGASYREMACQKMMRTHQKSYKIDAGASCGLL
jgi:hypothetical protein